MVKKVYLALVALLSKLCHDVFVVSGEHFRAFETIQGDDAVRSNETGSAAKFLDYWWFGWALW